MLTFTVPLQLEGDFGIGLRARSTSTWQRTPDAVDDLQPFVDFKATFSRLSFKYRGLGLDVNGLPVVSPRSVLYANETEDKASGKVAVRILVIGAVIWALTKNDDKQPPGPTMNNLMRQRLLRQNCYSVPCC